MHRPLSSLLLAAALIAPAASPAAAAISAPPAAGHNITVFPDRDFVHVIARNAAGAPLPLGQLEQRMVNPGFTGTQHNRDARAPGDGTLTYDAPGSIHWTATYAFSAADKATALDRATMTRAMWLGASPLLLNELTISEFATPGGPTPGCNAPLAQTAITTLSRTLVNAANAGQDITVDGIAQGGPAGVTGVSISLPESAGSAPVAAALSAPGAAGQMTWTATIPAVALADGVLPQGDFHLVATYAGPGAPPGETRTLRKDTIAPAAPTATPGPGTYSTAQAVSLSSPEAGAGVRYTVDGRDPVADSPAFGAPLSVTSSLGIRAVAVDAAGNASRVATFDYSVAPLEPIVVRDPAPAPVVIHDAPRTTAARITGLRVATHVRLRVARHSGIAVRFAAGADVAVARLRLFRAGSRTPIATKLAALAAPGRQTTVHLRARSAAAGRYRIEVTGGPSAAALGSPVSAALTLRR